jgi:hypothetical protein
MTTCGIALVVVAIMAGCGGSSDPRGVADEDVVKRAATVPPTTPGWNWPKARTSSSPYTKDKGGDPPPTNDPLAAKLYRQLRGLDMIGSAASRWEDKSKLAHLVVERFASPADAHSAMRPYREFAHGWAEQTGTVSDEAVRGLGDEAWRISARGYSEEVTYKGVAATSCSRLTCNVRRRAGPTSTGQRVYGLARSTARRDDRARSGCTVGTVRPGSKATAASPGSGIAPERRLSFHVEPILG